MSEKYFVLRHVQGLPDKLRQQQQSCGASLTDGMSSKRWFGPKHPSDLYFCVSTSHLFFGLEDAPKMEAGWGSSRKIIDTIIEVCCMFGRRLQTIFDWRHIPAKENRISTNDKITYKFMWYKNCNLYLIQSRVWASVLDSSKFPCLSFLRKWC